MSDNSPTAPQSIDELKEEAIAEKPWKYIGYRQYSRFLASDNDFVVLRRFGTLHVRALLALQDEISALETQLEELDLFASSPSYQDIHNGTFRHDQLSERPLKIKLIREKLVEYDDFLVRASHILAVPKAKSRDIASVSNWLYNNYHPIQQAEVDYLSDRRDVIPLVPKSRSQLRRLLEKWSTFRLSPIWRDHSDRPTSNLELSKTQIVYSSDERMERCLAALILLLGMIMLISPLWILNAVHDTTVQLAVITVYIVTFTALLSFATVAKTFESLAATAAYSAVLMVFFQLK